MYQRTFKWKKISFFFRQRQRKTLAYVGSDDVLAALYELCMQTTCTLEKQITKSNQPYIIYLFRRW